MTSRIFTLPLALLLAVFYCSVASASEPEHYHVYTFQPPAGFDTLNPFITATYKDSLDATTLSSATIDGNPAMTFWTEAGGIRQFNLLIQGDTKWILLTTAQLDFTQDDLSRRYSDPTADSATPTRAMAAVSTIIASNLFSSPCMIPANADNCVYFVRCLAPWLPHVDLTTIAEKEMLINSHIPKIGAVAVIPVTGTFQVNGHMAYVIAVNYGPGGQVSTISIVESHYAYPNGFDVRTGTPAQLNIAGYVIH